MKSAIPTMMCLLALLTAASVHADPPTLINYQGRLLNASDEPVSATVAIDVQVFNQESGGTAVWEQDIGNVLVLNGLYDFQFGDAGLADVLTNEQAWLELTVDGDTFSPRQRLVSVPYALQAEVASAVENAASGVPSGLIVLWHGALSEVPEGWLLCDGANGTPDLRDRFVFGASSNVVPGTTGGANSVTLTEAQLPSHSHTASASTDGAHTHTASTGSTGAHTHTADDNAPSHEHNHYQRSYSGTYPQDSFATSPNNGTASAGTSSSGNHSHSVSVGSGGSHTHTVTINSGGDHAHTITVESTGGSQAIENRPATLVLAYIMKS